MDKEGARFADAFSFIAFGDTINLRSPFSLLPSALLFVLLAQTNQ